MLLPQQLKAFSAFESLEDETHRVVRDLDTFWAALRWLKQQPRVGVDTETNGLKWFRDATICGVSMSARRQDGRNQNFYFPMRHFEPADRQLPVEAVLFGCREILEDVGITKVLHNIKFDEHFFRKDGVRILGPRRDTMIAAHLHDENSLIGLKDRVAIDLRDNRAHVAEALLNRELTRVAKSMHLKKTVFTEMFGYDRLPTEIVGVYGAFDTDFTLLLDDFYAKQGVYERYASVFQTEMDLTEALHELEQNGVDVDVEYLQRLNHETRLEMERLTPEIHRALGFTFKVSSDTELRRALLRVGCPLRKLTDKGELSVDAEVLGELSKESSGQTAEVRAACALTLKYKAAFKIASTYTSSVLAAIGYDGRVHANYKQVGTKTGRLSAEKPNAQNLIGDSNERAEAYSGKSLEDGGSDPWSVHRAFRNRPAIHQDWSWVRLYFDYCLHPSTLVETIDGVKRIDAIVPGDKLYAYEPKTRRITTTTVSKSQAIQPLNAYEIVFDNGEKVTASADHKWPVRVQGERKAGVTKGPRPWKVVTKLTAELTVGERMVPMRRSHAGDGYVTLYSHSAVQYAYEHVLVAEAAYGPRPIGFDVHHKDLNKSNNAPSNLEYVEAGPHRGEHSSEAYARQDHVERVAALREGLKGRRAYGGTANPNAGKFKQAPQTCPNCSTPFRSPPSKKQKFCSKLCWLGAMSSGMNHTIVSITPVGVQPMHAITVDSGNFVLAAGVVTYNSQIELRVLARYSHDPKMMEAFINGIDIHKQVSQEVFGSVEKKFRRLAKVINFGLSYCMSAAGFSRQTDIPLEEAERHFAAFHHRFPRVGEFRNELWGYARRHHCYVENMFGRPRRVPMLSSQDNFERHRAERRLIGAYIQGTAAELTKISLVRLWRWEQRHRAGIKLVSTIHDEISLDCLRSIAWDVARAVRREMTDFPMFDPIPIEIGCEWSDTDWSEKRSVPNEVFGLKAAA